MDERDRDDEAMRREDGRDGAASGPWRGGGPRDVGGSGPDDGGAGDGGRLRGVGGSGPDDRGAGDGDGPDDGGEDRAEASGGAPTAHILRAMEQARFRELPLGSTGRMDAGARRPIPNHLRPVRGAPRPATVPVRAAAPTVVRTQPIAIVGSGPARRSRGIGRAVGLGAVLALAIVAAALTFRPPGASDAPAEIEARATTGTPEEVEARAATGTPEEVEARATTGTSQAIDPADETPAVVVEAATPTNATAEPVAGASGLRVRVGPNLAPEQSAAIVAALAEAGYGPATVEVLPFRIATSRIGFYHAGDADAAATLAAFVTSVLRDADIDVTTRDYGKLLDDAPPGRLDVWIEG